MADLERDGADLASIAIEEMTILTVGHLLGFHDSEGHRVNAMPTPK